MRACSPLIAALILLVNCYHPDRKPQWSVTTVAERQRPRSPTAEQLHARLRSRGADVTRCYRTEAVNSQTLSSFEWRVAVPPDGSALEKEVVVATHPEQVLLRTCIEAALFDNQRFDPYDPDARGVLTTNFVIRAPDREKMLPSVHNLRGSLPNRVPAKTPDHEKKANDADKARKCESYCSMFKVPREPSRPEPGRDYYGCLRECRATKEPFSIPSL